MNKDGLNILIKEILEESYSKISAKDLLQLYNLEHLRHKGEYLDVFEKLVKRLFNDNNLPWDVQLALDNSKTPSGFINKVKNIKEEIIKEKAVSKAQQRLFGIAYAIKKGEQPLSNTAAGKIAKTMKKKNIKDFASTSRKDLPERVPKKESVEESKKVHLKNGEIVTLIKTDSSFVHYIDSNGKKFTVSSQKWRDMIRENQLRKTIQKLIKEVLTENVNEDLEQNPVTLEEKKVFLENVKNFSDYGSKLKNESDLVQLAEEMKNIVIMAERIMLDETDEWFDKITLRRNTSEMKKISENINKTARETKSLQERLYALYEDLNHVMSRYFDTNKIENNDNIQNN